MVERYEDRWDRPRDRRERRELFGSHEHPRYFGTRTGSYSEGGAGFGGGYGDRFDERIEEDPWSAERGPYRGALGYRDWPEQGGWRSPYRDDSYDPRRDYGPRRAGRDRWFSGGYDDGRVSTYRPPDTQRRYARGPKGYERSDDRIREDVSDRLMYRDDVDSSEVSVTVAGGKVTLDGTVPERRMKHEIEDLAEACAGVKEVDNRIRVQRG
jgi:hypothetical protein